MIQPTVHRFGLLDMMILIAGIAVAVWITPEALAPSFEAAVHYASLNWSSRISVLRYATCLVVFQPIAAILTLTILVLACRRCGSFRGLASHAGSTACLAASFTMLVVGPLSFAASRLALVTGLPFSVRLQVHLGHALMFRGGEAGIAVAAVWLMLILDRRWNPRTDWIDRAGRILGVYWIMAIPSAWRTLLI